MFYVAVMRDNIVISVWTGFNTQEAVQTFIQDNFQGSVFLSQNEKFVTGIVNDIRKMGFNPDTGKE